MKRAFGNLFNPLNLLPVAVLLLAACGKDSTSPALPDPPTNIQVVLSNLQYRALRQDGGFVRLAGGTYGIILYRANATTYRAFERLCP